MINKQLYKIGMNLIVFTENSNKIVQYFSLIFRDLLRYVLTQFSTSPSASLQCFYTSSIKELL